MASCPEDRFLKPDFTGVDLLKGWREDLGRCERTGPRAQHGQLQGGEVFRV